MTPTLVLCSRNARPQTGLARRPQPNTPPALNPGQDDLGTSPRTASLVSAINKSIVMPDPEFFLEGGRLPGLAFHSTGTPDGNCHAHHLIRGRSNSTFRRTATAALHRAALAHQTSVTSAIITKMIRSIRSSLLLSLIVWPALLFGIRSAGLAPPDVACTS